jgi:hypothetical protein
MRTGREITMFIAKVSNEKGKVKYIAHQPYKGWHLTDRQDKAYAFGNREQKRAHSLWDRLRAGRARLASFRLDAEGGLPW